MTFHRMASVQSHPFLVVSEYSTNRVMTLQVDEGTPPPYFLLKKDVRALQSINRIDDIKFTPGANILIVVGDSENVNAYKYNGDFIPTGNILRRVTSTFLTIDMNRLKNFYITGYKFN